MLTKLSVTLCLVKALNLGCSRLLPLVAHACIKTISFYVFLKFIEDKIAVERFVYTGLSAALVTHHSFAQDLPWQSQNRLRVNG